MWAGCSETARKRNKLLEPQTSDYFSHPVFNLLDMFYIRLFQVYINSGEFVRPQDKIMLGNELGKTCLKGTTCGTVLFLLTVATLP